MYFETKDSVRERARRARARQLQTLLEQTLGLDVPVHDDPVVIEGLTFTCRGSSAFHWLALLADCPVCGTTGATTSMSIREYADLEAAIRELERHEQSPCVSCVRRWKEQSVERTIVGGFGFHN